MAIRDADFDLAADHDPIVYYQGPIGGPSDWIAWQCAANFHAAVPHPSNPGRHPSSAFHTIYILTHGFSNTTVYVGKTRNVAQRFDAHRKRTWWGFVDTVELNLVSCSHEGDCRELDRAALLIENMTIGHLRPLANQFIPKAFLGCNA